MPSRRPDLDELALAVLIGGLLVIVTVATVVLLAAIVTNT